MKKLISILLLLLLTLGVFCGCAKDSENSTATGNNTTTTPIATEAPTNALSAEDAVQIYLDNRSVWEYTAEGTEWYGYLFLDLDFDGTLELIQATNAGTGLFSSNRYYKLDTENKTVIELDCADKELDDQWDFTGGDYPQIYKDNSTGNLKYMVYDNYRESTTAGGVSIGEMILDENGNVATRKLWSFDYAAINDDPNEGYTFVNKVYDKDGSFTEVDDDTYNNTLAEYEDFNTHMDLTYELIEHANTEYTYSDLSEEELFDLLLRAYNHYTYN